ncbi:MAG: FtsK/SpoIIIE domain-containing protein, partial [Planctomycetota bacterium]
QHFPSWQQLRQTPVSDRQRMLFLPVGSMPVDASDWKESDAASIDQNDDVAPSNQAPSANQAEDALSLPVVLHRHLHSGMVISVPKDRIDAAVNMVQTMLMRALTSMRPRQVRLTLIDPMGRGQHFSSLMSLADDDPLLVNHRVWTTRQHIDTRLAEQSAHSEDVLQSMLRDRYETIEDYNAIAGPLAEPYRIIAAVGFPNELSREATTHLQAIVQSGRRCGTFVILVRDSSEKWPTDSRLLEDPQMLNVHVDKNDQWTCHYADGRSHALHVDEPVPAAVRGECLGAIGSAAAQSATVQVPLADVISSTVFPAGESPMGNNDRDDNIAELLNHPSTTDDDVAIPIGSQGGHRSMWLRLGEGVRQHALVAGKTGSGKSTLLHAIITAGAVRYTPQQLQYYLLDFKKGVEFRTYVGGLPHARVIGIESEREFGHSVLERLDEELRTRGEHFRVAGVQDLASYRHSDQHDTYPMPRILLVVDEFQELFVRDDRLAADCAMLLDRLVRQGRSFGIHVLLASQTLAGSHALPRATLGQMAVRIAMMCSESDAAMILADDNTAARFLTRPGEAIYNDAGGLVEGNQPFQVAWLDDEQRGKFLNLISKRDQESVKNLPPAIVFEGNRPGRWSQPIADAAITASPNNPVLLLGDSVAIGPPTSAVLSRQAGRNLLVVCPPAQTNMVLAGLMSTLIPHLATHPQQDDDNDAAPRLILLDGNRAGDEDAPNLEHLATSIGKRVLRGDTDSRPAWIETVKPRDAESRIVQLGEQVKRRMENSESASSHAPVVVLLSPVERFRDLRHDESSAYSFSLDGDGAGGNVSGSAALQSVLKDGPEVGVHVVMCCGGSDALQKTLPRSSHHDLELRILGRVNAATSSTLIDAPDASQLALATMLLYDDADGSMKKFRPFEVGE